MALRGRLNELTPPEMFQLVSLTRKTGKLVMTDGERQGVVVFRHGEVVFAASDSLRSSFARTLASGKVVPDTSTMREVGRRFPGSVTDSCRFLVEFREVHAGALEEVASGRSHRGGLSRAPWDRRLVESIGGKEPREVVVVPLILDGGVVAVLYGDNLPRSVTIGTVEGLEILMHEIGLGAERARRLRR